MRVLVAIGFNVRIGTDTSCLRERLTPGRRGRPSQGVASKAMTVQQGLQGADDVCVVDRFVLNGSLDVSQGVFMSNNIVADRVEREFFCQYGHDFTLTFAAEADVPALWDCPKCGTLAGQVPDGEVDQQVGPHKNAYEQMMSRRTPEQMELMLAEALAKLQDSRNG